MAWLASILLLAAAFKNAGASWLAPIFGLPVPGMFYVLCGLWEAVLCIAVILLLQTQPRSRWRGVALSAAVIGLIDGVLMAACRLAAGTSIASKPRDMDLCDWVTGLPVGSVLLGMYVLILCYGVHRK